MEVYTVDDIAKILRLTTSTVRRIIRDGWIKTVPGLTQVRVTHEALDKYMKGE